MILYLLILGMEQNTTQSEQNTLYMIFARKSTPEEAFMEAIVRGIDHYACYLYRVALSDFQLVDLKSLTPSRLRELLEQYLTQ